MRRIGIIIPAARFTAANNWLKNNGYGDGNFSHEIVRTTDADDAAAVGYAMVANLWPAQEAKIRALIEPLANTYVVDMGNWHERKHIRTLLDEKGFKLRRIAE
jgi:hypothetical protein